MRRLLPLVDSGRPSADPAHDAWITVAFTYQGLEALGVPQDSLDSFAPEFRQGMAARAGELGDVGESSPANWERPLGTGDVHVAIAALSPDAARLEGVLDRARRAHEELPGVELIWRQDCYQLPTGRTSFGFKDGIGQPAVEGSGIPPTNSKERPLKAGEIILGYPDETGELPPMPSPDVLGRNGTYVVFRKLHTRVAAYRQYLRSGPRAATTSCSSAPRWSAAGRAARRSRSHPSTTTPSSARTRCATTTSCTATIHAASSARPGSHARRANPRDALDDEGSVDVRLHRMIRRGTSYGPMLPDGVLDDDGIDRGIIFVFAGAHLHRQFEFVKTQWLNDGIFIGAPAEKDPMVGANDGSGSFTIPQRPIRRRLTELPAVRRHPRRRVLLRSRSAGDAMARRPRDVTGPEQATGEHDDIELDRDRPLGQHSTSGRRRLERRRARRVGARRTRRRRAAWR